MALSVNGFFPGELSPSASVAGCIDIFENAWPNPDQAIQMAETECAKSESGAYWIRAGTIGLGAYQDARTNLLLEVSHLADVSNNPALQNIHNQYNMLLLAASIPYAKRYGIQENLWHEGYSMLKYRSGEEYKRHYDGGTRVGRAISAVCYLNKDYEGGEIEFPHFKIKIKPEPGMLILFPSNYAYSHIAHPVTDGTKYAMVTWIRDRET
jgi:predicted 2-oxoglutarate/Fe(II)-dependent dioxygenase YbiX